LKTVKLRATSRNKFRCGVHARTSPGVSIKQCFPNCGKRTIGDPRKGFKGQAAENENVKIVPEFYLLSDEL
jgi:hypothetical protein